MSCDGFLHRYFLRNGGKRVHKWVHYFDIYQRHFDRFRERPSTVLEIGVHGGGSLKMWQAYFHPDSKIVGIDISPDCAKHASKNIEIYIGSQDDDGFLREVASQCGEFDIVIDDGSHINSQVIKSFDVLYNHVAEDGVYLIEDMHTSYWPEYGGGLQINGSFIEFAKRKIDELNASHFKDNSAVTNFTRCTDSISFYDSIVVFEKRRQGRRQHLVTESLK